MPVSPRWIEHRRGIDGELLGWITPEADDFVTIDLLGREITDAVDWLTAEESLEAAGIGYLADRFEFLLDDGRWLQVRITELSPDGIRMKNDDWGLSTRLNWSTPSLSRSLRLCVPQIGTD